MLFNSFAFLLVFLPLALALYWFADRVRPAWRLNVLLGLSFVFYGYWDWRFIPLLALSILMNWLFASLITTRRWKSYKGALTAVAIALNLLVLGVFKYAKFFAQLLDVSAIPGVDIFGINVALPLGISFFTFHHIMYLVDLKSGNAPRYDLVRYGLYIAFFPQVLAGPLVRWSEIMHQFEQGPRYEQVAEGFARGIMLLVIGLAKKIFFGDPLAAYVNPVFHAAATNTPLTMSSAWQAVLGFTFQIYFDFSGYTDMALGIAMMFGIVLPQNFNVPYRAISLQDFWRRWHMTLSRFLRDYLYIPLGGNRHGLGVQIFALFATMTLGGLWHGAGLTFVAWGVLHGAGLCAGLLWRRARLPMPALVGWTLTFTFVTFAWVLFRAQSFEAALTIYGAMVGLAPAGTGLPWGMIGLSAAISLVGPTAWDAVQQAPLCRPVAVAFAAAFVAILLTMADNTGFQFIYFQF